MIWFLFFPTIPVRILLLRQGMSLGRSLSVGVTQILFECAFGLKSLKVVKVKANSY